MLFDVFLSSTHDFHDNHLQARCNLPVSEVIYKSTEIQSMEQSGTKTRLPSKPILMEPVTPTSVGCVSELTILGARDYGRGVSYLGIYWRHRKHEYHDARGPAVGS